MFLFKLVLVLAIIVAALLLVFRFHKQIRSGIRGATAGSDKREEPTRAADLEQFIAAYRRDRASKHAQPGVAAAQSPSAPEATPSAPAVKARAAFLSGSAKLAFLVLKAGLPDHHIFANTRVSDVMDGTTGAALANLPIDLLVCTKDLAIVAAVDFSSATQSDTAREKEQALASAGIRYLHFAPEAFPKPAEVRRLIYGE